MSNPDFANPLACFDCGRAYSSPAWVEAVIPDSAWDVIAPKADGSGVLCICCMGTRLVRFGLEDVPVKITAGPMVVGTHW
jgi:hypothetical protein